MHADVMSLFRELADCSAAEREACYAQRQVPAAIRAEVESLLRFDGLSGPGPSGYVAASAERALLADTPTRAAAWHSPPASTWARSR